MRQKQEVYHLTNRIQKKNRNGKNKIDRGLIDQKYLELKDQSPQVGKFTKAQHDEGLKVYRQTDHCEVAGPQGSREEKQITCKGCHLTDTICHEKYWTAPSKCRGNLTLQLYNLNRKEKITENNVMSMYPSLKYDNIFSYLLQKIIEHPIPKATILTNQVCIFQRMFSLFHYCYVQL